MILVKVRFHSLKICVCIYLKFTIIIVWHLSNSRTETICLWLISYWMTLVCNTFRLGICLVLFDVYNLTNGNCHVDAPNGVLAMTTLCLDSPTEGAHNKIMNNFIRNLTPNFRCQSQQKPSSSSDFFFAGPL